MKHEKKAYMNDKKVFKNVFLRFMLFACMTPAILMCGTGCHRDAEPENEKIASIAFDKERVLLKLEEETTVKVIAKSDEGKKNEKIAYSIVNEGIIEIKEMTNDGFIIKAVNFGSTVIMAKSQLVTSYLEVMVENESMITHYITVTQPVIEIMKNERKITQVNLYGGNALDNHDFAYKLENGKNNIKIEWTENILTVEGLSGGNQKITVSHPKSEYTSEILVFVKETEEEIKYISGISNVVLMPNDEQYHEFAVTLFNSKPEDAINLKYTITEGSENIKIEPNANICNVLGVRAGTSLIKVTHPDSANEFEVRLIVYDVNIPFIILGQTFLLMNIGESVNIKAQVENPKNEIASYNEFYYEIVSDDPNTIEVVQNGNFFFVRAKKGGHARVIVTNNQTQTPREILVVVRTELVYRDDYYITTSQNVVMTQVGAAETTLNIQLVNGNTADANGFEWTVDDGTIITVESPHGIVRGNRAVINSVFNAEAVITPLKAGTAKITIHHPKSEINTVVMVKVYPKGTFVETPLLVQVMEPPKYDRPTGLLKVISGAPQTVQLGMKSGDALNVGALNWRTDNANAATVNSGAHGMTNILNAHSDALTKLIIEGSKLESPHECLVLAGTKEFVDKTSVIYVDTIFQKMVTEQVVRIQVKDSQDGLGDSHDYMATVTNKNILYAVMVKSQLVLQGKDAGETQVRITHKDAINDIIINVRIDPAHITIDKPYYISGREIAGVVCGRPTDLEVSLVGADEVEFSGLKWASDDTGIVRLTGTAGTKVIATGQQSNKQTNVTVTHKKSENDKTVLVYVVEDEADLSNRVAIGLKQDHYLLTKGTEELIVLTTNANETAKTGIAWTVESDDNPLTKDDTNVITLDKHYDSAMMKAVGVGNAVISITHPANIMPQVIYVSVVDAVSAEKIIKGPAIIELIKGESKIAGVTHLNMNQVDISNIRWDIEDKTIASVQENGDSAYMLGIERGITYANITQSQIGYKHRATLLCANPGEILYIMGVEQSNHVMNVGDEKKIALVFGSNGFPESAKSKITWKAGPEDVVRVVGSGASASIVALNKGIGKVAVTSEDSFNRTLELTFDVRGSGSYSIRDYDKIIGIVVGQTKQTTLNLYDGGNVKLNTGYSLLQFETEDKNVISINPVNELLTIKAEKTGQEYITIRHPQAGEPARILVYTALTQTELDKYYPIIADKVNFLLQVGEQATVSLTTIENKDPDNLSKVIWGIENANILETPPLMNGKKQNVVTAKSVGLCVINITYEGNVVERIFISIVENNTIDTGKYIVTESIIGLIKGEEKTTTIFSNLSASELGTVLWESDDHSIVTVSGKGSQASLTAQNPAGSASEAYVTVTYGSWLKRHILVYVCDTAEQVKNYKAMNMENQYMRLGKNETAVLPLLYAPQKSSVPTLWVDKYDNKVVKMTEQENGGKLELLTLNEGVAVLEATNTGLSNTARKLQIYVEVSNRYTNMPQTPVLKYLTTSKTIYVLNPDEKEVRANLSVNGIGMGSDELNKVNWRIVTGNQYASIYPNGKDCEVRVNQAGLEGVCDIEAYLAENIVQIKVIVSRTGLLGFPHIVGDDIIRVGVKDTKTVEYDVAEIVNYEKANFAVQVLSGANVVNASMTGNILTVEGKISGQALLKISCTGVCQFAKEVVVIVTTTPDGLVYLTTRDNFSVVKTNEYKILTADIIGYDNAPEQGYTWTIDSAYKTYISLEGADSNGIVRGKQAQVKGLAAGNGKTAKITISHSLVDPLYNVSVYVRVSDATDKPKYITTSQNIITVKEGASAYVQTELVNGSPEDNNMFAYTSLNTAVASADGAGTTGVVIGKTVGSARIKITNDRAANTGLEVLVIVEKDTSNPDLYITSSNSIIELKPGSSRQVTAMLVGGQPQDINGFQWTVKNVNPYDKNKPQVIILDAVADTGIIKGNNEGEADIYITHMKTGGTGGKTFIIHVYVEEYGKLQFTQKSVSLFEGETVQVYVECPAKYTAQYVLSGTNASAIISVTGTNKVCAITGKKEGICKVIVRNIENTVSDELLVEVKKKGSLVRYIQTADTIYNMIDWNSSENRLIISGKPVGTKDDGSEFNDLDNNDLNWNIRTGANVIGIFNTQTGGMVSAQKGSLINVYSKTVGNAEIEVTHSGMDSGYKKTLYVYVEPYDANFSIEPTYLFMNVNDSLPIAAILGGNLAERDFSKVHWSAGKNEDQKTSIKLIKDNKEYDTLSGEQNAWVKAVAPGNCKLTVTYNNNTIKECSVYVEMEKYLRLGIDGYQTILPGQDLAIPIYVSPPSSKVVFQSDYLEYLDYLEGKNYKIEIVPDQGINREIHVRGGTREGLTTIKISANNIERSITLNTDYKFAFNLNDPKVIRIQPLQTGRISYTVFPEKDPVSLIASNSGWQGGTQPEEGSIGGEKVAVSDGINSNNQIISIKGLKAGYTVMRYESEYNKRNNAILEVPVYIYYDNVNVKWKLIKQHESSLSSFDEYNNVIRIADGEIVSLDIDHEADGSVKGKPGLSYSFDFSNLSTSLSGLTYNQTRNLPTIDDSGNGKEIYDNDRREPHIVESRYAGYITVKYQYYNGGKAPQLFNKNFMVYHETWSRYVSPK